MNRTIYITQPDMRRLRSLIESSKTSSKEVHALESELEHAQVVAPEAIPADVITMNSKAKLRDISDDEQLTYTLVFPAMANIDEGKISVLAPIGTAMLGQRVGDEVEWQVQQGNAF